MSKVSEHIIFRIPLYPLETIKKSLKDMSFFEKIIRDCEFQEAIYFSSPTLHSELMKYLGGTMKCSEQGRLVDTLFKYLSRMCSRCTPFGSMASCCAGSIGNNTHVLLKPRLKKIFRLDMSYLCVLSGKIQKDKNIQKRLRYRKNTTVYKVGNRLRYIGYDYNISGRLHKIEEVQATHILDYVCKIASVYRTFDNLVNMVKRQFDVSQDDLEQYVLDLIESQILVSEIDPHVIGPDYFTILLSILRKVDSENAYVESLSEIEGYLTQMNRPVEKDNIQIAKNLEQAVKRLDVPYNQKYLIQLDSVRECKHASLSEDIIGQLKDCMNFLASRMGMAGSSLEQFKAQFVRRYGSQEVPLLAALDPDIGLGGMFDSSKIDSPLINNLKFPQKNQENCRSIVEGTLLDCLLGRSGNRILEEVHLDRLQTTPSKSVSYPKSACAMFQLSSGLTGRPLIYNLRFSCDGAANMFARFAYCDRRILSLLHDVVHREQEEEPDMILAEIAHIPNIRTGNILARPFIRDFEIDYLSNSVRPRNQIIDMSDIMVSVRYDKVMLRSRKLKKAIMPRLTTAHNFNNNTTPVYRFLCAVQQQYHSPGLFFSWGRLENVMTVFPRVFYKDIMLSPAKWKLGTRELSHIGISDMAFRAWKERHFLPRYVCLCDSDNKLLIDLDNKRSAAILQKTISQKDTFVFEEFVESQGVCVNERGESFMNECIVPLVFNKQHNGYETV